MVPPFFSLQFCVNCCGVLAVLNHPAVMQPIKMPTRPYPMSKIVGQDMVKLALLLAAGEKTAEVCI